MSVYRRKRRDGTLASTYSYDFQFRARRFLGDTKCTTKRAAEKFEADLRREVEGQVADLGEPMTFKVAASLYWNEVGRFHTNFDTTLAVLEWLQAAIGAETQISEIDSSIVARVVAKRRGEPVSWAKDGRLPSNATVNRSVTVPLRHILRRAGEVHGATIKPIAWRDHMLAEPKERVREASGAEETAIGEHLAEGYDEAVAFAFLTGCRRCEIVGLRWPAVDFFSRRFTVTGKGGKSRTLPMSDAVHALLWSLKDHDPDHVFTYVAQRTLKGRMKRVRGRRYPMTESGLKTAMRRAVPKAGVSDFRFHDTRHTAATRVLRASNLKVVKNLLGHADIATTAKYAHALDDDLRDALNAAKPRGESKSPAPTPAQEQGQSSNDLKKKGIS